MGGVKATSIIRLFDHLQGEGEYRLFVKRQRAERSLSWMTWRKRDGCLSPSNIRVAADAMNVAETVRNTNPTLDVSAYPPPSKVPWCWRAGLRSLSRLSEKTSGETLVFCLAQFSLR